MITKHKNRYILVESTAPLDIRNPAVSQGLGTALDLQLGQIGRMESSPKPVFQYNQHAFIIRVNRGFERRLMLATAMVKEINGQRIGLYTIKTSGTIRTLIEHCKKIY